MKLGFRVKYYCYAAEGSYLVLADAEMLDKAGEVVFLVRDCSYMDSRRARAIFGFMPTVEAILSLVAICCIRVRQEVEKGYVYIFTVRLFLFLLNSNQQFLFINLQKWVKN